MSPNDAVAESPYPLF